MSKEDKLTILNKVLDFLPVGKEVEPRVVERLQSALRDCQCNGGHSIYNHKLDSFTRENKPLRVIAREINDEFECFSPVDFTGFKLKISKDAVSRFLGKSDVPNLDSKKNRSIQLIAAFLALPDIELIVLSELEGNSFFYQEAYSYKSFIQRDIESASYISLRSLKGVYITESSNGNKYSRIALKIALSTDQSHLLVEENYQVESRWFGQKIQVDSYGWCVVTDNDIIHIALMKAEGYAHSYQSVSLPDEFIPENDADELGSSLNEIALLHSERPKGYQASQKSSLKEILAKHIASNLFIFSKDLGIFWLKRYYFLWKLR